MTCEPEAIAQIHRIMEAIYKEEKHLTPYERLQRLHRESEEYIKRSGFTLKRISPQSKIPLC